MVVINEKTENSTIVKSKDIFNCGTYSMKNPYNESKKLREEEKVE